MTNPWDRLRQQINVAAHYLAGDGEAEAATGRRLRIAFARVEETLTGRGLWEALHPDAPGLFEELPGDEQTAYDKAAARLRGEICQDGGSR